MNPLVGQDPSVCPLVAAHGRDQPGQGVLTQFARRRAAVFRHAAALRLRQGQRCPAFVAQSQQIASETDAVW